jgi:hypothetical protein
LAWDQRLISPPARQGIFYRDYRKVSKIMHQDLLYNCIQPSLSLSRFDRHARTSPG